MNDLLDAAIAYADYPWTVCSWHGAYDETAGRWNVDQRWIDKARAACELLNTLSANPTGQHPPRLGGGSVAPGCSTGDSK